MFVKEVKVELVNCAPRSQMMKAGTPNLLTQHLTKASVTVAALMSATGIISTHLEFLSTVVNRYLAPPDAGSGPTISRWTV